MEPSRATTAFESTFLYRRLSLRHSAELDELGIDEPTDLFDLSNEEIEEIDTTPLHRLQLAKAIEHLLVCPRVQQAAAPHSPCGLHHLMRVTCALAEGACVGTGRGTGGGGRARGRAEPLLHPAAGREQPVVVPTYRNV